MLSQVLFLGYTMLNKVGHNCKHMTLAVSMLNIIFLFLIEL